MITRDSTHATARFGYWSALGLAVTTIGTFALAVATPPRSGPLCVADCFVYPYLDIAERFPRDYLWMGPAVGVTLLFVAFAVALRGRACEHRQELAQLGLMLSAIAATVLIGDYVIQLAVIQPSLLAGERDGVSMLSQFNPHGLFIALEELGFVLMSASLGLLGSALGRVSALERALRRVLGAGTFASAASTGWLLFRHGNSREYLLEITLISINWIVLIAAGLVAAAIFHREGRASDLVHVSPGASPQTS